MFQGSISRAFRRSLRRGERGQSLVILAFGFIALLGFVGIVADTSLAFVRYSSLRRAVDSAAIAAAGQIRRDRSIANVGLAARQFIEFHGLSPQTVTVNTCETIPTEPGQPNYNSAEFERLRDLLKCDDEFDRKLVHVVAEISSPTIFLRLVGWSDIALQAEAISETAVIDVVMIFDVSESMLEDTTYEDWADIGRGVVYLPPRADNIAINKYASGDPLLDRETLWRDDLSGPFASGDLTDPTVGQYQINARLDYAAAFPYPAGNYAANQYPVYSGVPSAYTGSDTTPLYNSGRDGLPIYAYDEEFADVQNPPREECRVRFYPYSAAALARNSSGDYVPVQLGAIPSEIQTLYSTLVSEGSVSNGVVAGYGGLYDGFVPTYNFYGCCNQPDYGGTGDFDFSNTICQPFRQAKDAAEGFLSRLDFVRGDRVAFVTFDQQAYAVDPDGTTGTNTPMMDTEADAIAALQRIVGVKAEPSSYIDTDGNGLWDAYCCEDYDGDGTPDPINDFHDLTVNRFPVATDCAYRNAVLPYPYSPYTEADNPATTGVREDQPILYDVQIPDPTTAPWDTVALNHLSVFYSYQFRAGCAGTNIGASLRQANNTLLDPVTTRREGAVWIMVLLSDGAAGASDPVRIGTSGSAPALPDPYNESSPGTLNPIAGDYGALGLCPYGTAGSPSELTDDEGTIPLPPYCLDSDPTSRHACNEVVAFNTSTQTFESGTDLSGTCNDSYYDVDDYARDWADFVALDDPDGSSGETQLPNIFSIGFGLDFELGAGTCAANVNDCLGEELLRYIADVGDNYAIDTDHQQEYLYGPLTGTEFGQPGPCENPAKPQDASVDRLPPTEDCGNYFNAPDQDELEEVFDEIASRMFTRLTR